MEAIWCERHASALTQKIVASILPRLAGADSENG
jgi:hypothetical protein